MIRWTDPVGFLKGSTTPVRKAWLALGITTIKDLLLTPPRRYDDYSQCTTISETEHGDVVTVKVKVQSYKQQPTFRKRIQLFTLIATDATGTIRATFFQQPWLKEEFYEGREVFLSGKIAVHPRFGKQLHHPLWEPVDRPKTTGSIAPVYGLTGTLVQKTYRRLIQQCLEDLDPASVPNIAGELGSTMSTFELLKQLHAPHIQEDIEVSRQGLAYCELMLHHLSLHQTKIKESKQGAPHIASQRDIAKQFAQSLPFTLTGDQKKAIWGILLEMTKPEPLRALLQGDVGSGKTVVAAFLSAMTYHQGQSTVLLVPTELLATQHAATFQRLFAHTSIPVYLFTRTHRKRYLQGEETTLTKDAIIKEVQGGNSVIIGTHALLVEGRLPEDIALAIIDEQHRFGVDQREILVKRSRKDGLIPHLVSMTATPIPRTLALTLYSDLHHVLLREKPAGRLPIATTVCRGVGRDRAYEAIREAITRNERAYIVYPLIEASDTTGAQSVLDAYKTLSKGALEGIGLGIVHGKQKPKEQAEAFEAFRTGKTPVLLSTTVIEVGVDVPEATIIMIEHAERFGLAQLHQLRGRVGRSNKPSMCFLATDVEGDKLLRLQLMERMQDGFALAEEDLKLRGSGKLFGTIQSGKDLGFRFVQTTDLHLMKKAKEQLPIFLQQHQQLTDCPAIAEHLTQQYTSAHLE